MKKFLIIILLFIMHNRSNAEFIFAGDVIKHQVYENYIEFQLTNCKFNLYIVDENIIRLRYTNQDQFSEAPSYAVINKGKNTGFSFSENDDFFEIKTSQLITKINKSPCRVSFYDSRMNLINSDEKSFGVSFDNDEVRCFKTLFKDEKFYGLGEKTGNLMRNGNQYTMWNSDTPEYTMRQDPLYQSIPFFIGIRDNNAYGIFFDNTYKSYFNMGASNDRFYWFGAEKGEMDYYFIYGPEIKKVINSYTFLTGRMKLPPKWALGYQQSKWSYYPESGVRNLAENFRDKQIPCDVIYLDIHYMDDYRVFTWNEERFPDPVKLINDLKNDGFKIITIVDPGVKADTTNYSPASEGLEKDLFVKYPDGDVYKGEVWPSWAYFPDFTKKETRDWWGKKNAELIQSGLAGIWNDMNEPAVWGQAFPDIVQFDDNGFGSNHKKIHNVYALEMARSTYEGIVKAIPDNRSFILTRAGFSGIQRYAAVWTGDNAANEDHLKFSCVMLQGMGLSGISFCGSDVGGFFGSPSPRLYIRWLQLGAFTPFFRGHTIINTRDQEPWAFGEDIERWSKEVIELRYRLLPYLYNEFYNSSQTGLPVMQPMFLNYQADSVCYYIDAQYQFMFGENLLVAPVLSEHENFKKVYLPEGKWLDWWTNKIYDGKQWVIVEAPVWRIPLFIKEGGVIPMQAVQNYVGEKNITEYEVKIFPSANSEFILYEDDGETNNYQQGEYSLTEFSIQNSDKNLAINTVKNKTDFNSEIDKLLFEILNIQNVKSVEINNNTLTSHKSLEELKKEKSGYYLSKINNSLFIKTGYPDKLEITVEK